jgi:hypothetical protein
MLAADEKRGKGIVEGARFGTAVLTSIFWINKQGKAV